MSIISLEDLEAKLKEESVAVPEDLANNTEFLEEAMEKDSNLLDSINKLDTIIENHDRLLKGIEENEVSLESLQQTLQDNIISTNHIMYLLTKHSLKNITSAKKQNITFESISNSPVATLRDFNNLLKEIRSKISQEDVKNIKKGWFEKFSNKLKVNWQLFRKYEKLSQELLKQIAPLEKYLEMKEGFTLKDTVKVFYFKNLLVDTAINFHNIFKALNEIRDSLLYSFGPKGKKVLKHYKPVFQMKTLKELTNGLINSNEYPIGLSINIEQRDTVIVKTVPKLFVDYFREGLFGDQKMADYHYNINTMELDLSKIPDLKSEKEVLDSIKLIYKRMKDLDKHFDREYLEHSKLEDDNPGLNFSKENDPDYNREEDYDDYDEDDPVFNKRIVPNYNAIRNSFVSVLNDYDVYDDMYLAQKLLLNTLKPKDNLDDSTKSKIKEIFNNIK